MAKSQIELLVVYQDLKLMLSDLEDVTQRSSFSIESKENLHNTLSDLEKKIESRYLNGFRRLTTRYRYPVVPVQNDTCLGCNAKLPTSYAAKGRTDQTIYTCENCGRILYWIE